MSVRRAAMEASRRKMEIDLEERRAAIPEAALAAIRADVEAGRLSTWAVPERVMVVDEIDKTSVGKLDKKRLRARYGRGGPAPTTGA